MSLAKHAALLAALACGACCGQARQGEPDSDPAVASALEAIRQRHDLPAMGGAIVSSAGLERLAVVGVRRRAGRDRAEPGDAWHMGSETKAMTAELIATLVSRGALSWDLTVGQAFPEVALREEPRAITLLELVSHRSGLPHDCDWASIAGVGSLTSQRRSAVAKIAGTSLLSAPGAAYNYSNWGYVVAAAMAERATHEAYERLMQDNLFGPLHMIVGYGPVGTGVHARAPWAHTSAGVPTSSDNPLVMAPAGCAHCSLEDWSRFIADLLRGLEGKPSLLGDAACRQLREPPFGGTYALGWGATSRGWGGGRVYTHTGSNTLNVAIAWVAPARDFAVLVTTNQGGAEKACDEAASALIQLYNR